MPSVYTAFKIVLSIRLCAAIWSNISDCDETYNYWEPMHYLLYGNGFQTWEYSPVFAIRSYAYLWLHILPIKSYQAVFNKPNTILVFYFLRCFLSFCCALSEIYLYRGVSKYFGANTGRLMLFLQLLSTGFFISCSAFLPSSFAMYMTMVAMGAMFLKHYPIAILAVAASTLIGWPFAAVIGVPVAWELILRQKNLLFFIKWSFICLVCCLGPVVAIDTYYYGRLVVAPLSIVMYNIFSSHGPNIYGVEAWSFYFINGFLNFNIVFFMALLSLPIIYAAKWLISYPERETPVWVHLLGMYLWIAIFFTRPHKEERFLFPIYPLFCLAAALVIDHIQKVYHYISGSKSHPSYIHYSEATSWISVVLAVIFGVICMSRTMALYKGYHAPLDLYVELHNIAKDPKIHTLSGEKQVNVCIGKEWYRFPSSFFLFNDKWQLQFIRSEFRGLLPKPYEKGPKGTMKIPRNMNDLNREEPSRYIDINKCHYLIDLDLPNESPNEPRYSQLGEQWKILHSIPFLDNSRSNKFFRAFYIPFLSEKYTSFSSYNLLKTKRTKQNRTLSSS